MSSTYPKYGQPKSISVYMQKDEEKKHSWMPLSPSWVVGAGSSNFTSLQKENSLMSSESN